MPRHWFVVLLAVLVQAQGTAGMLEEERASAAASVPLPGLPTGLAVDAGRDRVYVAAPAAGRVVIVDPAAPAVVGDLRGGAPARVAVDALRDRLYVAQEGGLLQAFSLPALALLGEVAVGAEPRALLVHPGTGDVYVLAASPPSIARVDAQDLRVLATVPLPSRPYDADLDVLTGRVLLLAWPDSRVLSFDAALGTPMASEVLTLPMTVTVHPQLRVALVTLLEGRVVLLDPVALKHLDPSAHLGRFDGFFRLKAPNYLVAAAAAPDRPQVYFAQWRSHHTCSQGSVQTYPNEWPLQAPTLDVGGQPVDIALDSVRARGYTADRCGNNWGPPQLSVFPLPEA